MSISTRGYVRGLADVVFEDQGCSYFTDQSRIVGFIMQLFDDTIESRGDLYGISGVRPLNKKRYLQTSTEALSDCTSHNGSNCSTRAPGLTNHCIICTSRIPGMRLASDFLIHSYGDRAFANICKKKWPNKVAPRAIVEIPCNFLAVGQEWGANVIEDPQISDD